MIPNDPALIRDIVLALAAHARVEANPGDHAARFLRKAYTIRAHNYAVRRGYYGDLLVSTVSV